MNNNGYFPNGYFPNGNDVLVPQQGTTPSQNAPLETTIQPPSTMPQYAENIFELNVGKQVKVFFSYPDSIEWRDKAFEGKIEDAGRDYLLLKTSNGESVLLWLVYINYAVFPGEIITSYPRPINQR